MFPRLPRSQCRSDILFWSNISGHNVQKLSDTRTPVSRGVLLTFPCCPVCQLFLPSQLNYWSHCHESSTTCTPTSTLATYSSTRSLLNILIFRVFSRSWLGRNGWLTAGCVASSQPRASAAAWFPRSAKQTLEPFRFAFTDQHHSSDDVPTHQQRRLTAMTGGHCGCLAVDNAKNSLTRTEAYDDNVTRWPWGLEQGGVCPKRSPRSSVRFLQLLPLCSEQRRLSMILPHCNGAAEPQSDPIGQMERNSVNTSVVSGEQGGAAMVHLRSLENRRLTFNRELKCVRRWETQMPQTLIFKIY